MSKNSTFATKSKNTLKKQLDKTEEAQSREKDDEVVEISLDDALTISTLEKAQAQGKLGAPKDKGKGKAAVVDSAYRNSDDEGDDVEDHGEVGSGVKAFSQRELVALAFAGDNVVEVCQFKVYEVLSCSLRSTLPCPGLHRSEEARDGNGRPNRSRYNIARMGELSSISLSSVLC